jgi:hypothetical protein
MPWRSRLIRAVIGIAVCGVATASTKGCRPRDSRDSVAPILARSRTQTHSRQQVQPQPQPQESGYPVDVRELRLRVSVLHSQPATASLVRWRQGGEGLGGQVRRGTFALGGKEAPLPLGSWSDPLSLSDVFEREQAHDAYLTVTAGNPGKPIRRGSSVRHDFSRDVTIGVRVEWQGRTIDELHVAGPHGGTATLVVPGVRRDGWASRIASTREVAEARRARSHASSPGVLSPPTQFRVVSDLGGFGTGSGYGVRSTDQQTASLELDTLRQLGVNSLRAAPALEVDHALSPQRHLLARFIGPVGYPVANSRREKTDEAGCPFAPGLKERVDRIVTKVAAEAQLLDAQDVWVLTRDEIGAVTDLSVNGKQHMVTCPRCRDAFVAWLRKRNLTPAQVGARSWSQVRPLPIWKPSERPWSGNRGLSLRAVSTRQFLNEASASLFTPIRDAFARRNKQTTTPAAAPQLLSYALRGSNFLTGGASLDMFEFYRHADNAVVWETSNRDPRVWGWDSYVMDVQRVLGRELGLAQGVYIKPHRGAPVQRMLSAVSRGDSMLYWYTYGPDYWKGDAFSTKPDTVEATARAARLLVAAEPYLYGATLAQPPAVAIVKPESTFAWATLSSEAAPPVAALENANWVYAALQHAHVPVDPLDEGFLTSLPLSRYAAIYVNGTHLSRKAAAALKEYVRGGGTLVTTGWGMARDEADGELSSMWPVFGLSKRWAPEAWCDFSLYRSVALDSLEHCLPQRVLRLPRTPEQEVALRIGREVLLPAAGSEVLASFDDGQVAAVRSKFGRGEAILWGAYLGLEYAAPVTRVDFDMARDFSETVRDAIVAPALRKVQRDVTCSSPLVEAQLLKSATPNHWAITLANWGYKNGRSDKIRSEDAVPIPAQALVLEVRGLPDGVRARSVALGRDLAVARGLSGDARIELAQVGEGDVVLLDAP